MEGEYDGAKKIEKGENYPSSYSEFPIQDYVGGGDAMPQSNYYSQSKMFKEKKPEYMKSRDIISESWDYNSIVPSMRTLAPVITLFIAPFAMLIFGMNLFQTTDGMMMMTLLGAAFLLYIFTFILRVFVKRINHGFKDTLVHGAMAAILLFVSMGLASRPDFWKGYINVFSLYLTSHLIAHGVDFHLERSKGRGLKLLIYTGILTLIVVYFGYAGFNLGTVSIFG